MGDEFGSGESASPGLQFPVVPGGRVPGADQFEFLFGEMLDRVDPRALVRYADERHSPAPSQRVEAQGLGIGTRRAVEGSVEVPHPGTFNAELRTEIEQAVHTAVTLAATSASP